MTLNRNYLFIILLALNINKSSADTNFDKISDLCGSMSCDTVFSKIKKFARSGSPHAQAVMALFYRDGYGVEIDQETSVSYMKKAARAGLPFAQYDLAILYRNGYFVEKDVAEGNRWLKLSAKSGFEKAIELLLTEHQISDEESVVFREKNSLPKLEEGEQVLTITRDKYTLSDLIDLITNQGFSNVIQTGTRIKGKGCGNSASNCITWKLNSPVANTEFMLMINKINAIQTASQMGSGK